MTENAAPQTPESATESRKKWLVGVLYYGAIDREHDRCVKALHGHPLVHDVLELTGCPYIDIGRSIIATSVLDAPELGGLLFIDHDMVFDPKEAIATIESAIEADATVGAPYSMRKPGHIIGGIDGGKVEPGRELRFFQGGARMAANYLGMGMTAIPRSVLVRLVEASDRKAKRQTELVAKLRAFLEGVTNAIVTEGPNEGMPADGRLGLDLLAELVPELRDPDLPRLSSGISDAPVVPFFSLVQRNGFYYGEDVSFCLRSHLADIPVCIDTRIRVYHKGSYCYGLEDVSMEVPYCESLVIVDTANPKAGPALFSRNPDVQRALEAAEPALAIPTSFDPTRGLSVEASG